MSKGERKTKNVNTANANATHPSDDDESERREILRKTQSSSFTNTFGNSSLGDSRDKISLCR